MAWIKKSGILILLLDVLGKILYYKMAFAILILGKAEID